VSCVDVWRLTAPYIAGRRRTATHVRRRVSPYVHVPACRMRRRTAPYAVWTGLQDHQWRCHVCSNDCPWDHDLTSISFAQRTECWPPRVMQFNDSLMRKTDYKTMCFLVCMYYTQPCYQTSIFGKNCAYYIRIFTLRAVIVTLLILSYIMSCSFSLVAVHVGSQMAACRSFRSRTLTVEWVLREWCQSCRAKCPTTIRICLLHSSCQFIRYSWSIRWF